MTSVRQAEIVQHTVERVTLGVPAATAIRAEAERSGAKRIFIVAGGHLAHQTDEIERIVSALEGAQTLVHTGIRAHVPIADVLEATKKARDFTPDLFVGVGGGSVTDATKVIALTTETDVRSREDLMAIRFSQMAQTGTHLTGLQRKVVLVPATLSAGEYNMLSGAMDEESRTKQGFGHDCTVPRMIVLDPAITLHTPLWLWLSTGCRAVDHAVETLVSDHSNPFADGLAESALKLLSSGLSATKEVPNDLEARLNCQIGAWQASIPLTSGVPMGASHAIGHALGGFDVPHGYTSCVMMPYVQRWNAGHIPEQQGRVSEALGRRGIAADVALDELVRGLGLPRTLREVGIGRDKFEAVARIALHDQWARTNPRPLETSEQVLEILKMAEG